MSLQLSLLSTPALSVTEVTRHVRLLLESDPILQDVWVTGEISNLSRPTSGHIYFTLKDQTAQLKCVIWRTQAQRLRIDLQNGMAVEARGSVSVYEASGQYQLYVVSVRPAGDGLLFQEFMRLKAALEDEGLFDEERKRPIPERPRRIGLVTSPTGAALQDMLQTLGKRYPLCEVILSPCQVQGQEAPAEIVRAIRALNRGFQPDVIILARGGGSLEDLWAFNDERVVRAVCASAAPVVTGIGHETDFTLCDFAADLRAPTPTGAAVLCTPDIADLRAGLVILVRQLDDAYRSELSHRRERLARRIANLRAQSPEWRVRSARQRLDQMTQTLRKRVEHTLELRRAHVKGSVRRLESLNPRAVLQRGFAVVRAEDGRVVRSVNDVDTAQAVNIEVFDGSIDARVEGRKGK